MSKYLRYPLTFFVLGAMCTAAFAAGASLVGTPDPSGDIETPEAAPADASVDKISVASGGRRKISISPPEIPGIAMRKVTLPNKRLPAGRFLVGASRASIFPAPKVFGGDAWQTSGCTSLDEQTLDQDHALPPVDPSDPIDTVDEIRSWPASSPDCIYLGGFGIGPARPAESVGHGGVWVRAVAISNGETTFIYEIADAVGWFARYDPTICDDCGILDVRHRIAKDTGLDAGNIIVASTHSHATADTYGGWGGIPDWYRAELRDATIAAAKQAIANMRPATLTVGSAQIPARNNERRDTYYSNVDPAATFIQARIPGTTKAIATMSTFGAHPTIVGGPILHADWPGASARRFEKRWGGVGLMFEGGLGNSSISGVGEEGDTEEQVAEKTGIAVADDISRWIKSNGVKLRSNDMVAATKDVVHPVTTNPALLTLGSVGLFDREFIPLTDGSGVPGSYFWSKQGEASSDTAEDTDLEPDPGALRGCFSTGPTINTSAGAHRIGEAVIGFAPGEIFSNMAEVVKERIDTTAMTMVIGQANDALGYLIQSFEFDLSANVATEYGTMTGEYEEVFATDRCIGDHVLETMLEASYEVLSGS